MKTQKIIVLLCLSIMLLSSSSVFGLETKTPYNEDINYYLENYVEEQSNDSTKMITTMTIII